MSIKRMERWPELPVAEWQETRDTLQLYTQIVGKVRLANEPTTNHWWNVPLYVTSSGLTTSLMPHATGPAFQIDFDFLASRLDITTDAGDRRSLPLEPRTVADFYRLVMGIRRTAAGLGAVQYDRDDDVPVLVNLYGEIASSISS